MLNPQMPKKISEKILLIEKELKKLEESASYYGGLLEDGADNNNYSSHYYLREIESAIKIKEAELRILHEVA